MRKSSIRLSGATVIALVTMLFGVALLARPAWHWGLRRWAALEAAVIWRTPGSSERPGSPALWLKIPSCKINTLVVHGASRRNLRKFPCLVATQSVILAHRDTHFRGLRHLRIHDRVEIVRRNGGRQTLRVADMEILSPVAAQQRLRDKADTGETALMTCYPFHYIGPAPKRFLVWLERDESVSPRKPAAQPTE